MKKQYISAFCLVVVIFSAVSPLNTSAQAAACIDLKSSLNIGSRNSSVVQLQDFLRAGGHFSSVSTGYFGPLTFNAVKSFQTKNKISAVGNVGPITRAEIKKLSCISAPVEPQVSTTTEANISTGGQVLGEQIVKTFLPYKSVNFNNWKGTWGVVATTTSGTLMVKASTTTQGGAAILPESSELTDFRYTASVSISNGDVKLIGRRIDDQNYIACVFDGNWIGIKQKVNGEMRTLASTEVKELPSAIFFQRGITVAMRVKGDTVGCTSLGDTDNVTYTGIDKKLVKGAIGVETDFSDNGAATMDLREVKVEAI